MNDRQFSDEEDKFLQQKADDAAEEYQLFVEEETELDDRQRRWAEKAHEMMREEGE